MYKRLFIASLIGLAACSGDVSQDIPKAVQNEPAQDFAELTDAIAQDFINYVGDDMELLAISHWQTYKPKQQCFDYWHKKGDFIPTPETINKCQLWVNELAWLYGTYGYSVKPQAFKSQAFWQHLENHTNSPEAKMIYDVYRKNRKLRNPNCPNREQKGWTEQQEIPWGSNRPENCPPGETW